MNTLYYRIAWRGELLEYGIVQVVRRLLLVVLGSTGLYKGLELWFLTPLSTNRSVRRKALTCCKSLTNFITWSCIEYILPWAGFKLTTLVVICTDCIGSCKSNYHTFATTMALVCTKNFLNMQYMYSVAGVKFDCVPSGILVAIYFNESWRYFWKFWQVSPL